MKQSWQDFALAEPELSASRAPSGTRASEEPGGMA